MTPKRRVKAIDFFRMGTAPEAHQSTLEAMLKIAKNSHFDRGYRKSPEALLIERILRLKGFVEQGACAVLVDKEKSLVSAAVAHLVGASAEGFSLPAFTPLPPLPAQTPEEEEQALQDFIKDLQKDGMVDEDGYFTEDPN
jgi:hypothetical protein